MLWPFLLLFWFTAAYALWLAEHSVNPVIQTFSSALMYSLLTACTVGYGSFTPMTIEGKLICGDIVFVAIGIIGFASARLTATILNQSDEEMPWQVATMERDIAEMKELLKELVKTERMTVPTSSIHN
jgi:voltage-gated potassium channel